MGEWITWMYNTIQYNTTHYKTIQYTTKKRKKNKKGFGTGLNFCKYTCYYALLTRDCVLVLKRTVRGGKGESLGDYLEVVYLVTALVPSLTACLANSPGRSSLTAVWISREVMVLLLL